MSARRPVKKNSSGEGVAGFSGQRGGLGMDSRNPPEIGHTSVSLSQAGRKKVSLARSRSFMDSSGPRRVEAVSGEVMKRWELEARLRVLKQKLHEKCVALQALLLQEKRLVKGSQGECSHHDTVDLPEMGFSESPSSVRSAFLNKHRFSSDSSCKSRLSSMTEGSEDGYYQKAVFDDSTSEAHIWQTSEHEDSLFTKDHGASPLSWFSRNRSISEASSGSGPASPLWDTCSLYSDFATLPRKSRRGSVRKHILKFIPGLHKSMEKEETDI